MRILVHVTATEMLRHFIGVVRLLADRGHEVRVAHIEQKPDRRHPPALVGHPRISFVPAPEGRSDSWAAAANEVRALRDYLRYLEPAFAGASKLRGRALARAVTTISGDVHRHVRVNCPHCRAAIVDQALVGALTSKYPSMPGMLADRLAMIETLIPGDRGLEDFVRAERPDVLLVIPLIWTATHQVDYVKAARTLGIPVGYPVFSWDNLTTKGLIHEQPDRVFVWNEWQKREAVELHRVPPERVTVTGAPRFDGFYAMQPQTTRAEFCETRGLDPAEPIVAYFCSSEFVANGEHPFVRQWIDHVRQHPGLARCNILVRPHPRFKAGWRSFDAGHPRVAVTFSAKVIDDQLLYDTIHHSAAIVGLNTSAQLEAGIVGRPVLTLLAPQFAGGQERTLHFQYLLRGHGGFVELARDFEEHCAQLAEAVAGHGNRAGDRAFIEAFLRPCGPETPASTVMAQAIEQLASTRSAGV